MPSLDDLQKYKRRSRYILYFMLMLVIALIISSSGNIKTYFSSASVEDLCWSMDGGCDSACKYSVVSKNISSGIITFAGTCRIDGDSVCYKKINESLARECVLIQRDSVKPLGKNPITGEFKDISIHVEYANNDFVEFVPQGGSESVSTGLGLKKQSSFIPTGIKRTLKGSGSFTQIPFGQDQDFQSGLLNIRLSGRKLLGVPYILGKSVEFPDIFIYFTSLGNGEFISETFNGYGTHCFDIYSNKVAESNLQGRVCLASDYLESGEAVVELAIPPSTLSILTPSVKGMSRFSFVTTLFDPAYAIKSGIGRNWPRDSITGFFTSSDNLYSLSGNVMSRLQLVDNTKPQLGCKDKQKMKFIYSQSAANLWMGVFDELKPMVSLTKYKISQCEEVFESDQNGIKDGFYSML